MVFIITVLFLWYMKRKHVIDGILALITMVILSIRTIILGVSGLHWDLVRTALSRTGAAGHMWVLST